MPNRKIHWYTFKKFVVDNGWLRIYDEKTLNLIRYITPMGIVVDTKHEDDTVEVLAYPEPIITMDDLQVKIKI